MSLFKPSKMEKVKSNLNVVLHLRTKNIKFYSKVKLLTIFNMWTAIMKITKTELLSVIDLRRFLKKQLRLETMKQ